MTPAVLAFPANCLAMPAEATWRGPRYTGEFQHYVELPGVPHIVVMNSPVRQETPVHCGMSLLAQFVQNPKKPLDTSCLQQIEPINFSPSDPMTRELFGTADVWGSAKAD